MIWQGIRLVIGGRIMSSPPGWETWRERTFAALVAFLLVGDPAMAAQDYGLPPAPPASSATDQDDPPPLQLKPLVARPLTAADLPPSNVFVARPNSRNASFAIERRGGGDPRLDRGEYRAIIEREATAYGVPAALVDAVMARESSYNPDTVGADGEIGLMQLMPATARMLGFSGTPTELAVPETNIHFGVVYLAGAWRLARGDICTAAMKYRAGHSETRFSYKSVDYCIKLRAHLAARGYNVTGNVPVPTFGQPASGASRLRSLPQSAAAIDLQALNGALLRGRAGKAAVRTGK
jgi:soluble lytic murein transglycosylase-like protein